MGGEDLQRHLQTRNGPLDSSQVQSSVVANPQLNMLENSAVEGVDLSQTQNLNQPLLALKQESEIFAVTSSPVTNPHKKALAAQKATQGAKSCRICLGDEDEIDNRLISPCKCAGTMKYIHVSCLQEWVNGKKSVRELKYSQIYVFKISQCELCKNNFPGNIH